MKESGEAYAKSQFMFLRIDDFDLKKFDDVKERTFGDEREIIIDDNKIIEAGRKLQVSFQKINSYIDNSKYQTSSDQMFGYYSSDDNNPRLNINEKYKELEENLIGITEVFTKNFQKLIDEDKEERDKSKQKSIAEYNDFKDIF